MRIHALGFLSIITVLDLLSPSAYAVDGSIQQAATNCAAFTDVAPISAMYEGGQGFCIIKASAIGTINPQKYVQTKYTFPIINAPVTLLKVRTSTSAAVVADDETAVILQAGNEGWSPINWGDVWHAVSHIDEIGLDPQETIAAALMIANPNLSPDEAQAEAEDAVSGESFDTGSGGSDSPDEQVIRIYKGSSHSSDNVIGTIFKQKIALQGSDGHYLSAINGGGGLVLGHGTGVLQWETFTTVQSEALVSGSIIHLAAPNGQYVAVDTTASETYAHDNNAGTSTNFYIIKVGYPDKTPIHSGDKIALQAYNGKWLTSVPGLDQPVHCMDTDIGNWGQFVITFL